MAHPNKGMVYRHQDGMTLYLVILMMVVVFTLAGGFMTYTYVDLKNANHISAGRQECYSANAGVEKAIYIIKHEEEGAIEKINSEEYIDNKADDKKTEWLNSNSYDHDNEFCKWDIDITNNNENDDGETLIYFDINGYDFDSDYHIYANVSYNTSTNIVTITDWKNNP